VTSGVGKLALGTPSTLSVSSPNNVTTTTHSHAVTSRSDTGSNVAFQIASLLASDSVGGLTLHQLSLYGNLAFTGADRNINASNSLYLTPTTDLVLNPGGLVLAPNAQDIRTITINDLPTGIDGFRLWNRYANYTQLTIGAIKADELYVRVFVADETRIDRGEEYWSKSFGIIQTDFTVPAVGSNVDVWFEDAPGMSGFNLFSNGDYLLCRTIDWGTGLTVQKIWFQVAAAKLAQETTAVNGVDRQQWRIKRIAGGATGTLIKRGNLALDTGVVGQGWVHLSALSQDGGPFIQVGTMTSISTVPQFTNYVRMGNLNGTVDYSTNVYGFAAGSGTLGLGTAPSGGFSGITAEATNGLRLFNTAIAFYDGSVKMIRFDKDTGLTLDIDVAEGATFGRYIRWQDNVDSLDVTSNVRFGGFKESGSNKMGLQVISPVSATNALFQIWLSRSSDNAHTIIDASLSKIEFDFTLGGPGTFRFMPTGRFYVGAIPVTGAPSSTIHAYNEDSGIGVSTGVTIEQAGLGDSLLQFLVSHASGPQRWVLGIDKNDNNKFKIGTGTLGVADKFVIDTSGNITTPLNLINTLSVTGATAITGATNITGALAVTNSASALQLTRTTSSTTSQRALAGFLVSTSGVAVDGFGPAFFFQLATIGNPGGATIGQVGAVRDGSDTSGSVVLSAVNAGALVSVAYFTKDGNAGIGTSSPLSILHVYENSTLIGASVGVTIEQDGTGDALLQFYLTGGRRWLFGIDNSDGDKFKIDNTNLGTFNYFVLDTSGNIGIGTGSPGVDIIGTYDVSGKVVHIEGGSSDANLVLRSTNAAHIDLAVSGTTAPSKILQIGWDNGISFLWGLNDSGGLLYPFITMDHSSGRVGINNSAFIYQFAVDSEASTVIRSDVYSNTAFFNYSAGRALGTKASPTAITSNTPFGSYGFIGYTTSGWSTTATVQLQAKSIQAFTSTAQGSKFLVFTTPINTITPALALEIGDSGQIIMPSVPSSTVSFAANAWVDPGTGRLYMSTSSERYKTEIESLPDSYGDDFILSLRPVIYRDKQAPNGRSFLGFIAEDVDRLGARELVTYDKHDRPDALQYERFTAPLVAAVQDLIPYKARIVELEKRVIELERRLN
jgi:hypothetical protein